MLEPCLGTERKYAQFHRSTSIEQLVASYPVEAPKQRRPEHDGGDVSLGLKFWLMRLVISDRELH